MRIGVDVGGTTVKIGLIEDKKIIKSYEIKTIKDTLFDDIFNSLINTLKEYNKTLDDMENIGFGLPGNVINNYIVNLPNIGIKNLDLNMIAKKYTKLSIKSSNDANCAALGEDINDGDSDSSYFITLGTGVGGGYVYNHKLVEGNHFACGEVGHIKIDKHNYSCTCGLKGCLETVASATGIVRLAKEYKNEYKTNIDFNNITAKAVIDAARNDDELGLFVLDYISEALGRALSIIAVTNDIKTIYIGGGVSKAGSILIDGIRKYYKEYAFYACKNTEIKLAALFNDAGMLGAAYL